MRRFAGILVVTLLLAVPAITVSGQTGNYKDSFSSVSYDGNDGSYEFPGPWEELGDDGGVASGEVYVGEQNCSGSKPS